MGKLNKKILFFTSGLIVAILTLFSSVEARDPFYSPLFEEEKVLDMEPEADFPDLVVEGILWTQDLPQTIISGVVYKEGDMLKEQKGKIVRIEKDKIILLYEGRVYKLEIKKKED